MDLTLQSLKRAPSRYSDFIYYEIIVEQIVENKTANPDIAIESCKSLIEGISKSILKHRDSSYRDKGRNSDEIYDLFKKAINALAEGGAQIEEDFSKATGNLINKLARVRNERGDISHGKSAPKELQSTPHFARFIEQTTDGLASFMLEEFYHLPPLKPDPLNYNEQEDFNAFLDELTPIEGGLSYSKALFEQDEISYALQLEEYKEEQESQQLAE